MRTALLAVALVVFFSETLSAQESERRESELRVRRTHIVEAVEKVRDSVVNISSNSPVKRRASIFGVFEIPPQKSSGSGFVIHEDGYIVTNDHVVAQSTDHRVRFIDGREYKAEIVARDPRHDLAVLRIEPDSPLKPIPLGRSDDIMLGEDAIAIGNPFGLENTITRGVISAVNRRLEFDTDVVYDNLIQTDASTNPGNSGGPLLNALGQLIGVNTAIRRDAENVGFAIPVDQLRRTLIEMLDVSKLYQVRFGMRVDGAPPRVVSIENDGPADKAGAKLGDEVVSVDGVKVGRAIDFCIAMLGRRVGDVVRLGLSRNGKAAGARVRLEEIPRLNGAEIAWNKLGLRLEPIPEAAQRRFDISDRAGMVIAEVDPQGPAAHVHVSKGDLLVGMGQYRAWPIKRVGLLLKELRRGEPVDIVVYRFYANGPPDRIEQRVYAR